MWLEVEPVGTTDDHSCHWKSSRGPSTLRAGAQHLQLALGLQRLGARSLVLKASYAPYSSTCSCKSLAFKALSPPGLTVNL